MIKEIYRCPEYEQGGPNAGEPAPYSCIKGNPNCGRSICRIEINTNQQNPTNTQIFKKAVERYRITGKEKMDLAEALLCELDT